MKHTIIVLLAITLISCNTTREVQMQRGVYEVVNNRVNFKPIENWHKLNDAAPDTIFRLRNTSVKKYQLTY